MRSVCRHASDAARLPAAPGQEGCVGRGIAAGAHRNGGRPSAAGGLALAGCRGLAGHALSTRVARRLAQRRSTMRHHRVPIGFAFASALNAECCLRHPALQSLHECCRPSGVNGCLLKSSRGLTCGQKVLSLPAAQLSFLAITGARHMQRRDAGVRPRRRSLAAGARAHASPSRNRPHHWRDLGDTVCSTRRSELHCESRSGPVESRSC